MIFKRILVCALAWLLAACSEREQSADGAIELRIGHFPNVTHVQGLVARHFSRTGQGWFEQRVSERVGRPVRVVWYSYNAGPGAMEALFAHSIDLTYVGPCPVINAYVKAQGREVRIIAGAVEGGAALVVPQSSTARCAEDFRGQVLATPQLGNTQDVSCRAWLQSGGLRVTLTGGDATIMPTRNTEQLSLFAKGHFAGVWTVEPWVSRLEQVGGKVLLDERTALTTVLAASEDFLRRSPELVQAALAAHSELTQWISDHPTEAQQAVAEELRELTQSSIDPALIRKAWPRIRMTARLNEELLRRFVKEACRAGFLRREPDITGLISLSPFESK